MPAPSVYTEAELAAYMHSVLGAVAAALGYTAPGSYQEAVNETLLAYGVDDIADATDIRKLRMLARVQAWQLAANDTAGDMDFKAGSTSFSRSQVHEQVLKNLSEAQVDALCFDPSYQVESGSLDWIHDPYQYRPEDERAR
jgi:hypothetical protein